MFKVGTELGKEGKKINGRRELKLGEAKVQLLVFIAALLHLH